MITNIVMAFEITALGMGLVFLAIVVLWLMMWALTALPFNEDAAPVEAKITETGMVENISLMEQAAAAAVAIALAEQSLSTARPLPQPPTTIVSAWQLGMRTRQMYEKGGR